MTSEAGHETPKVGQPARSDRTDVTGFTPVMARWGLTTQPVQRPHGNKPRDVDRHRIRGSSADAWRSQD